MCKRDWHQSLSCDEAASEDAKRRREEDKESEKMVGKVSKPCPGCGVKIEKDGGCVNMHCEYTIEAVKTWLEVLTDDRRCQVRMWILLGLHGQIQCGQWRVPPRRMSRALSVVIAMTLTKALLEPSLRVWRRSDNRNEVSRKGLRMERRRIEHRGFDEMEMR